MTEDTLEAIMQDLRKAVEGPKVPFNVRQAVKRLEEFFEAPDEDGEDCPDCGKPFQPDPRITQITPAADGWRAVFAESDDKDPLSMSVEPVMFFAVLEFPDGYSVVSGMCSYGGSIMPCFPVGTFVGYVPPGKNPDMLADKVREKIKEIHDQESNEPPPKD